MSPTPANLPELTKGPVVVKAWGPWCSSCRAIAPQVERTAATSGVTVVDLQVDADHNNLVETFGVRSVPTLIGLHDGIEVARLTGAQPAETIEALFTTTRTGTGSVTDQATTALIASRSAARLAVAVAGIVLASLVLFAVGVALLAWALVGLVRRAA